MPEHAGEKPLSASAHGQLRRLLAGAHLQRNHRFLLTPLRWLIAGLWFLLRVLLIVWASLAIYYSNLPSAELRLALAIAFAAFAIWVLWVSRQPRMLAVFVVLFLAVGAW